MLNPESQLPSTKGTRLSDFETPHLQMPVSGHTSLFQLLARRAVHAAFYRIASRGEQFCDTWLQQLAFQPMVSVIVIARNVGFLHAYKNYNRNMSLSTNLSSLLECSFPQMTAWLVTQVMKLVWCRL